MKPSSSLLARLDSLGLALLCLAMCGQIDVRHFGRDTLAEGLGYASKTFALALSDVLFVAVVALFVARTAQLRAWKRLWWPPLPCYALVFALFLSLFHSPKLLDVVGTHHHYWDKETKAALADIAQWVGYFLVAPWVLVNLLFDRRDEQNAQVNRVGLALGALVAGFVVSGLVALVQLQGLDAFRRTAEFLRIPQSQRYAELAPRAFWGSPNLFAAFVAFLLPFLDEIEVKHPRFERVPLGLSLFAFGTLWLCVASPWAALAALAGLLASWLARPNPRRVRIMRLAMILFAGLVFGLTWSANPMLRTARREALRVAGLHEPVKKQWIEWQVAATWNDPKERALATGYGAGNYQINVGPLYQYGTVPNDPKDKMPHDSNNLYLVQAVSIGILGLGALLWTWGHFAGLAWRAARSGAWLGAATFGALVAWACVNPFHAFIVRGGGLLLGLFFALAVVAGQTRAGGEASKGAA